MANAWQASCTAGIYAYNSILLPPTPHPMTRLLQDKYVFCRSLLAPLFQLSLPATDTEGQKDSTEHARLFSPLIFYVGCMEPARNCTCIEKIQSPYF
jgi:hypothetical protein